MNWALLKIMHLKEVLMAWVGPIYSHIYIYIYFSDSLKAGTVLYQLTYEVR